MSDPTATQGAAEPSLESKFDSVMEKEFELPQAEGAEPSTEAVPEASPEAPQSEASEAAEAELNLKTLEDLAEATGLSTEQLLELQYTLKIDGKEKPLSLKDIVKVQQLEGHVNNKSVELSNQLKAFQEQANQFAQWQQAQVRQYQAMGQYAQMMLNQKFQGVDWNALKATDPIEYASKWTEFQQEQGSINAYLQQVNAAQQQQQAQAFQGQQARLSAEMQALAERRPEWREPERWSKDWQAMTGYAKQIGLNDDEINSITDHRHVLILDAAARYAALQSKKPEITQRVQAAPKLMQAGTRKGMAKQNKLADFKARLAKDPRNQDLAAAAFAELAEQAGYTS